MATTGGFSGTGTTGLILSTTAAFANHTNTTGATGHIPFPMFHPTIATYFGYYPNLGMAVWATIMFGLIWLAQTALCIYWKTKGRPVLYFLVLPVVAGSMEILSYAIRAQLTAEGTLPDKARFIIQLVVLLIAPIFAALANYLLMGRIVRAVGAKYSMVRPVIIERFFVIADVASFLVQGIGAAIFAAATTADKPNQSVISVAQTILVIGFVIQLAAIAFFLATVVVVDVRTRSHPEKKVVSGRWRWLFSALYISVSFILIRSIYRVIEFEAPHGGGLAVELASKEVYFGVLELGCMVLAFLVYVPLHPGFFELPDCGAPTNRISDEPNTPVELVPSSRDGTVA